MGTLLRKTSELLGQYEGQKVVDAKSLQNPLLELWGIAEKEGAGLTSPIEEVLTRTVSKSQIAVSELEVMAASIRVMAGATV